MEPEGFALTLTRDMNDLTQACNLIVTATRAVEPVIEGGVRRGTHITAVGADAPGKQELATQIVAEAGDEHRVIAFANPLRSLAGDAAHLTELIKTIDGPVVLAGHSYGGAVITNVPAEAGDIVGLVFVAAFATDAGESPGDASSLVPGATLAETIETVPLPDGGVDQYIAQDKFRAQFCADVPDETATLMAVTQRPITQAALSEPSANDPLWKQVPSWFIFGDQDRNIPVGAHRIMAERANAKRTLEIPGASHAVGVSHAEETAEMIVEAARSLSTGAA
jgi:pimeloyl-ACP methyl ester carboxylesterase